MQEINPETFKEYAEEYWSNVAGAFFNSIESAYKHYADLDLADAKHQKNVVIKNLHKSHVAFIQDAQKFAQKAKQLGMSSAETANIMGSKIFDAFRAHPFNLGREILSATQKARISEISAASKNISSAMFKSLGIITDVANISIKVLNKDYHGATAASISAVSTLLIGLTLAAAGASAIFTVPLIVLLGVVIPKTLEPLLREHDPFGINPKTNTDYQSAQNVPRYVDPLALDLNGDGIKTVSANSGITFDFDGDGLKTGTGWLNAEDGFLVLDRNNNGTIDNGGELFGVDTVKSDGALAKNGFDALRDLDTDGNGVFDAYDALFEQVRVWQDKNQDGISQVDELKTLTELGISSIHLESNSTNRADNGYRINANF